MKNKVEYTNRYNDAFTFSKTEDGDILFEGEFKWMRCSWPNVYDDAYNAYCADVDTDERMTLGEFKEAVHEYDKETFESTPLSKKYRGLVYSDQSIIDMNQRCICISSFKPNVRMGSSGIKTCY